MAGRQFKEGLDFFPLDTTFFANDKVQLIEAEFGVKGVVVALRLLCKIYDKGYYYQWGGDECLLFSRTAGAEFVPSAVNEIVNGLVRRRFFDEGCFDRFGILTSQAIQEVYLQVCERRKQIDLIKEYILIDLDKIPINVHINSIDVDINGENDDKNRQRKGKQSKGKVKEIIPPSPYGDAPPLGDGGVLTDPNVQPPTASEQIANPSTEEDEKKKKLREKEKENFLKFQQWIANNAPQVAKLKEPFTQAEFERIKQEFAIERIQGIITKMHNWKPLLTKRVSANLTFRDWSKKEYNRPNGTTTISRAGIASNPVQSKSDRDEEFAQHIARKLTGLPG